MLSLLACEDVCPSTDFSICIRSSEISELESLTKSKGLLEAVLLAHSPRRMKLVSFSMITLSSVVVVVVLVVVVVEVTLVVVVDDRALEESLLNRSSDFD